MSVHPASRPARLRWLVPSALAFLVGACIATVPAGAVDDVSLGLLARYGITPIGATTIQPVVIEDPADQQWFLPLEVSRDIELDFADLAGRSLELRTTPIQGRSDGMRAHVLVHAGVAVGAWISQENASGVLSLEDFR